MQHAMEENLNKLVENEVPTIDIEKFEGVEMIDPNKIKEETVIKEEVEIHTFNSLKLINLQAWLEKNKETLKNISQYNSMTVHADGVDKSDHVMFSLPKGTGEKDDQGNIKRDIFKIDHPALIRVPDLNCVEFKMLDSRTFKITQAIPGNINLFVRSYLRGEVLVNTICLNINNQLIPYEIVKVKKKKDNLEISLKDEAIVNTKIQEYRNRLVSTINMENVYILYKQAEKAKVSFQTHQEMYTWFMSRHNAMKDVNHLLQIDGIFIKLFQMIV